MKDESRLSLSASSCGRYLFSFSILGEFVNKVNKAIWKPRAGSKPVKSGGETTANPLFPPFLLFGWSEPTITARFAGETLSSGSGPARGVRKWKNNTALRATKRRPESGNDVTQRARLHSPASLGIKVYFGGWEWSGIMSPSNNDVIRVLSWSFTPFPNPVVVLYPKYPSE